MVKIIDILRGDKMELPKRKQNRLKGYDYSSNAAYFVTICTDNQKCLFGKIVGNGLDLSDYGNIAENDLKNLPRHFPHIILDKYIIMPNHIHAIIIINKADGIELSRPLPPLSTVIGLYKSGVSRKIGLPIWQKSFHDHIIRNEKVYQEIWEYIDTNPLKWELDYYHIY